MQIAMSPEGEIVVEKAVLVGRTQIVHMLSVRVVVATELGDMTAVQPMVADNDAAGTDWVSAIADCIGRAWNDHNEVGDGFGEGQPVGYAVEVKAVVAAVHSDAPVCR